MPIPDPSPGTPPPASRWEDLFDELVELPEPLTRLERGSMVDFLPFSELGL